MLVLFTFAFTDIFFDFLRRPAGYSSMYFSDMVDLLRGPKSDRVDVTLAPEELELMDNVLLTKYGEAWEEEKLHSQREDFSDMVAENANKRKWKMQEKDEKSKKKDFKF